MITTARLRHRIDQTNAWEELSEALEGGKSAEQLKRSCGDWEVFDAFGTASVRSEKLREKIHAYPMPDWQSMGQYSDFSLLYHLQSGLKDASSIAETIALHGRPPTDRRPRVLDFGAGLGRILRYMVQFVPEYDYSVSEVNPLAIGWGRSVYPGVDFLPMQSHPPLALSTGSVDVAYAWSIFSHYSEELHLKWLQELARLIRSGGLLILTAQSRILLDRAMKEDDIQNIMRLRDMKRWEQFSRQYDTHGYVFYESYAGDRQASELGIDPATFGMAFLSLDYINRHWSATYEVLEYTPGKIANFQDYIVLRRK